MEHRRRRPPQATLKSLRRMTVREVRNRPVFCLQKSPEKNKIVIKLLKIASIIVKYLV